MPTNGGEEHVLGENTPLALALSKALGSAIVSECDTRSDCIKSSFINNKCNLYKIRLDLYKYTIRIENDNLTSDPPSALLRAGA